MQARMDHDFARVKIIDFSVLSNMRRGALVSSLLTRVHVLSNAHISVVATSGNDRTSCPDFRNRVSPDLDGGIRNVRSCYKIVHAGGSRFS